MDNDVGLFFRSLAVADWGTMARPPRVVAITGSNGKSTTCALLHHVLTEAGRPSQLAGNIGRGVLDIEPPGDGAVVVLELSSYQTELARALTPTSRCSPTSRRIIWDAMAAWAATSPPSAGSSPKAARTAP